MQIYNLSKQPIVQEHARGKWFAKDQSYFILCVGAEIKQLADMFKFDQGTIEECVNIDENVRFDSFEQYDFISLSYFYMKNQQIQVEEINLYISHNYVVVVIKENSSIGEEVKQYVFQKLWMNIAPEEKLNKVYFLILDKLVTNMFLTFECIEDQIQKVEEKVIRHVKKEYIKEISEVKCVANKVKKHLRPLLYIGDQILINENKFIRQETMRYFKNIDIRINKLYDFALDLRDMCNEVSYVYDTGLTAATNEIAARLTVGAIFFAPLTVITGIYGMNFDYMPELHWGVGYPLVLGVMALITMSMYIYAKKKKWL